MEEDSSVFSLLFELGDLSVGKYLYLLFMFFVRLKYVTRTHV